MEGHHLNLPSDIIFQIGSLQISNSVLGSFLVSIILIIAALLIRRGSGLHPSRAQIAVESLMGFFMTTLIDVYGSEARARKFLPLILSFFLFLFLTNEFFLIPLVSSIYVSGVPHSFFTFGKTEAHEVFRISTSDWSQTLALSLITVIGAHIIALTIHPIKHIGAFIRMAEFGKVRSVSDFLMACINFFIGFIELIGEVARPISLSARLFGNIFAGEMMVVVITGIASFTQFLFPMPFIALGVFVGLVQAFVFTFLSLLFMGQTIHAASHSSH